MLSQSAPSGDASALSISPVQPGVGHAPLTAVNAYAWAAAGGEEGGASEGRGLHCFLSSFGLCWLRQLIKNSIFISPIIHFDFIVEWVVGGAGLPREQGVRRMGGCCVGRKVSTGRGGNSLPLPLPLLSLSVHNFKVFALLSCTLIRQRASRRTREGGRGGKTFTLAFGLLHFNWPAI